MTMRHLILGAAASLLSFGASAYAAEAPCYTHFYKEPDLPCIDSLLEKVARKMPPAASASQLGNHANDEWFVGFLAVVFSAVPEEKQSALTLNASPYAKSLYIEALYRAGLQPEAKDYADKNGLSEVYDQYDKQKLEPLGQLRSDVVPASNDALIGAYMASGDKHYIDRMLANYVSADDAMAADGFRVGLMQSKFGASLKAPGRDAMSQSLCQKYQCKAGDANMRNYARVLTLASTFWALQSLAPEDKGIQGEWSAFFETESRLNKLKTAEETAFANYTTQVAVYSAAKDNQTINASLAAYENFAPAAGSARPDAEKKP